MPVRTSIISGNTEIDTDLLMSLFGVPQDHYLVITSMIYSSSGAAGAYMDMSIDHETNYLVHAGNPNPNQNKLRLYSAGADLPFRLDVDDNPMVVQNKIFFTPSGAEVWTVIFFYTIASGGEMDLSQEAEENYENIKQIGRAYIEAGGGFYQVGDRQKVGIT